MYQNILVYFPFHDLLCGTGSRKQRCQLFAQYLVSLQLWRLPPFLFGFELDYFNYLPRFSLSKDGYDNSFLLSYTLYILCNSIHNDVQKINFLKWNNNILQSSFFVFLYFIIIQLMSILSEQITQDLDTHIHGRLYITVCFTISNMELRRV